MAGDETVSAEIPLPNMTESSDGRVRAFLAVEVTPTIYAALVRVKSELAVTGAAVRWVRDDALHVTVKFLGSVSLGLLDMIHHALRRQVRALPAFSVRVAGLGVFPNLRRPRVVWVGSNGSNLVQFARVVEATVAPLGFVEETRPFRGHITLGRVNSGRGWPRLEEALTAHWSDDFGTVTIRELAGFRSDLRRDGAVYTRLWTVPLDGV